MENEIIEIETEDPEAALLEKASELGLRPEALEVVGEEEAGRGILGIGKRKAKLQVRVVPRSEIARNTTSKILGLMGLAADIEVVDHEDMTILNVSGDDLAIAIGRHGQTLDAIQLVVGIISSRANPNGNRVAVDIEGYRKQRQEDVVAMAERAISRVLSTGQSYDFRPMSAFDRKTIHTTVASHEGVSSISTGEEPERQVTIRLAS